MELYRYKALDQRGKMTRGRFDAVNPDDLEARLRRAGLDLVSYKLTKVDRPGFTRHRVKRPDLITFCFHLEHLTRAGVPILEGLMDLRDSVENPRLREITTAMIESIGGGKSLSEAMADFPSVFSSVFVALVRAGERSGQVPHILNEITENLKWQDEQASHAKKILVYPTFVGTAVMGVLLFMMTYLVPQLMQFIQTMNEQLPFHSMLLIEVSNFFVNYWYLILLAPVVIIGLVYIASTLKPSVQYTIDHLKLKLPRLGAIMEKMILTRFCNAFAMMYASGIPVLECIRLCESVVGNKVIEQAVRTAGRNIAEGSSISVAFKSTDLFPPLILRMLRIGENTGALEKSLANVTYFYQRDVRESVERLQAIIEPALTITLGLIMLWILVSILGPIYDLVTQIDV